MPILDIPHRTGQISGPAVPAFPATVMIQALLVPGELFGEAPLSGRLNVSPPGQAVHLRADTWHGGMLREAGGRFAQLKAAGPFFDLAFEIEGSAAKVVGTVSTDEAFRRCIALVSNELPAFLSCYRAT